MNQTKLEGIVALVIVDVEGGSVRVRSSPESPSAVDLAPLAEERRGALLWSRGSELLFAFTSAPRALEFSTALQEDPPEDRYRMGVHVGEITHRDGEVFGSAIEITRRLAHQAAPGQTLVSPLVHDMLLTHDVVTFEEVPAATEDAGPPTFLATGAAPTRHNRPPVIPPSRIVDQLEEAVSAARLALVLAGPGSGKTTVTAGLAGAHPTVWLTVPPEGMRPAVFARAIIDALRIRVPGLSRTLLELAGGLQHGGPEERRSRAETLATTVAEALGSLLPRDLLVVVDRFDHLANSPICLTLLEALARNAPPGMHLVLVGQRDPGLRLERLRTSGMLITLTDDDLRLTDDEAAEVVTSRLAAEADEPDVHTAVELADGHPETAVLVAGLLRRGTSPMRSSGPSLARSLLRDRHDLDQTVLQALAALGSATPSLLDAVTGRPATPSVTSLVADGLVREVRPDAGIYELGAAARVVVDVDDTSRTRIASTAARVLRSQGQARAALRVLRLIEAHDACLDVLRHDGRRLLADGEWPAVLDAVGDPAVDPSRLFGTSGAAETSDDVELAALVGEAWRLAGDRRRALAWFAAATAAIELVPSWLAWRMGILLHFGGELDQARKLYARTDRDGAPSDLALVHAWSGAAAWMQSDIEACRAETEEALRLARADHDDQALAATFTVRALLSAVEGDRAANDQLYLRALEHAERAGDLVQLIRIRTNRGSKLLEEGEHLESLAELEIALHTADLTGAMPIHAMALSNRGLALRRLGRLDEAIADLVASRDTFERTESRWVGYALGHLGELYSIRGERALALAAYEEALAQCQPVGDTQGTVPALTGLALLLRPHAPKRARQFAEQACAHPNALGHTRALAALAEVAIAQDDLDTAMEANREGLALARHRRDLAGLATHLELRAKLATSTDEAAALLDEAGRLWNRMGCVLEAARNDVARAALDPSRERITEAERAVQTLRSHGARAWAEAADSTLSDLRAEEGSTFHLRLLGARTLLQDGVVVPNAELPGEESLDLLSYLVVERDHRRPSDPPALALWPHDPDADARLAQATRRLADLLGMPPDEAVQLPQTLVSSDLSTFLAEAERGLTAHRRGNVDAEAHLIAAEAAYGGDLLEDAEPAPWLTMARDDLAEIYLQVTTTLVDLAEQRGDTHGAVRLLLRMVERDPYDEGAHLRLVAGLERAGRRGESRRRYRAYAARMQEIGVEPAAFPDASAPTS